MKKFITLASLLMISGGLMAAPSPVEQPHEAQTHEAAPHDHAHTGKHQAQQAPREAEAEKPRKMQAEKQRRPQAQNPAKKRFEQRGKHKTAAKRMDKNAHVR